MNILLLGADGQVGQELTQTLAPLGTVAAWGRQHLDLSQLDTIQPAISLNTPDVIVNAAAYTAVDRAESEPDLAHTINGKAVGEMAKVATVLGATLIHISTDYVFAGDASTPYQPTSEPKPLGEYGRSKLAGEEAVKTYCDRHCIVRTAWVYGAKGTGNFVKTMLRLGKERSELRVVADQVGSPTWSLDLAQAIASSIPALHTSPDRAASPDQIGTYGTYHYTNSGVASWYDFAVAIFEEAAQFTDLAVERVIPITTADYPTPAHRPHYSVLDTSTMSQLLGYQPPHWRQRLRSMLAELLT
ncbi:MAG: dTDP-4-dehydrorhamnose reductase [Synechococcus sp.]